MIIEDRAVVIEGDDVDSREHPPLAMKAWGVRAVVGPSFARIFR